MKVEKVVSYNLWLKNQLELYKNAFFDEDVLNDLIKIKTLWENSSVTGKKVIFVGNGGSAAMASHCAVDLTKNVNIRAINFNEADLITCFANDYGYEHWVEKAFEFYGEEGDTAVLISSSGVSENIVNGAVKAKEMGMEVITLSGFDPNNPLRKTGDINLWVDNKQYNIVEMTHQLWMLVIIDLIQENPRINDQ